MFDKQDIKKIQCKNYNVLKYYVELIFYSNHSKYNCSIVIKNI